MYTVLKTIQENPEFKPGNLEEKIKVERLISMGLIKPFECETSDEYIALLLTRPGRDYLRSNLSETR